MFAATQAKVIARPVANAARIGYVRTVSYEVRVRRGTYGQPQRTGVIAMKCGMIPAFDAWGVRRVLTVLKLEDCEVTQVKTREKEGFDALQVGSGLAKLKNTKKPLLGHFKKAGVLPKRHLAEFRVSSDALLPVGTKISAAHFKPGQYVDVQGKTIGKGFQGGMKRWGFKGQPASHGTSKTHRSMGSSGGCQDPGKVFKGKKMAGHMGNKTRTVQNLLVYQIDPDRDLIFVEGHVPGKRGSMVRVKDAVKKLNEQFDLPYPTFVYDEEQMERISSNVEAGNRYIVVDPPKENPLATLN